MAVLKKEVARLPVKKARFREALQKGRGVSVIAEIKRKSPSRGILRKDFNPVKLARDFKKGGAAALSVLTDRRFFGGSDEILKKVKKAVRLPVLRKDFTIDEYQVWQSRLIGADAILLIACLLPPQKMKRLAAVARKLGLDSLYEVHTERDLRKVFPLRPTLLGINNRDLHTFHVDLHTTGRLARKIPQGALLVSESGVQSQKDILYLKRLGVKAVLVGESLMKEKNPGAALRKLLGSKFERIQ